MSISDLEQIRREIRGAEKICLFGLGTLLTDCYHRLVAYLGREPDFVSDNDQSKWGMDFYGLKCIPPEAVGRFGKEIAVVISVRQFEAIRKQLREMGVTKIYVAQFDGGYYALDRIRTLGAARSEDAPPSQSPPSLKDRWTLVTGASRGVGRQIALAMARLGSHIVAHSRSDGHVQDLVNAGRELNVQIIPLSAELSDPRELEAMLSKLTADFQALDYIFNNAAISPLCPTDLWSMPGELFSECYAVNTIAPIRICQRLIPGMMERGFGRIINVNTHIQNRPYEIAYACSKAALDKFAFDIAPSLADTGVMMSMADPGWVKTDAGGPDARYEVESVIPGILLGAVLDADVNGKKISAQDYAGLTLPEAMAKAIHLLRHSPHLKWI